MMATENLQLVCPSEKAVIGVFPVVPGLNITRDVFMKGIRFERKWKPEATFFDRIQDGEAVTCPRCSAFLCLKAPADSIKTAIARESKVPLILGGTRFSRAVA